ncbi:signal peptide peptidase SppA [Gloeobacter morelensis]|uniref:Protease 4 n=1 Tax=Gloeobacter morelensis MG652769 TaxID=2781736 RepID=A0ABY3PGL0_9CYAN|nr:signal peptide peptidase SppA [Gloeobacter morelensis]UFP92791.1 signal peptide peptidase SppA [Gloeobacter morelensis MG652769]
MSTLKIIGLWLGRILAVIGALAVVLAVVAVVGLLLLGRGPQIADNSVLEIKLAGDLPEKASEDPIAGLLGTPALTFKDALDNLKKAAKDPRIKGVVLRLDGNSLGWARVEELREAIAKFRQSGKFAVGYAEGISERGYYLALALDRLYLPPTGGFEMNGLVSSNSHLPGLLAKVGIGVQYFRYGKYKSVSGETFGQQAFSEPVKAMINFNLTEQYDTFVSAVAAARKIPAPEVRRLIDTNRPTAEWALANKLIDGIAYWDEVEADLKKRVGLAADKELEKVSASEYARVNLEDLDLNRGPNKIGYIVAEGLVVSGGSGLVNPLSGGPVQGSEPLIKALREAGQREEIKAVVMRVNSPGGAGLGCDLVRREVERLRAKKPVVVSMGDSAASGGYWIAMDASAIVAQPSTQTGSIGIFAVIPNVEQLNRDLTLTPEVFKRGARADALGGNRPLNPEEAKIFDQELLASYRRFVALAAKGRNTTVPQMEAVAQGRTWLGRKALELGLVDRLGGIDTAIALAAEKAKVAPDSVALERLEGEQSTLASLLGAEATRTALRSLGIEQTASRIAPPFSLDVLLSEHLYPLALPQRFE